MAPRERDKPVVSQTGKILWHNLSEADLLQMAEYAEQMEKFDDMRQAMKHFLERRKSLSNDERNLFVDAYKTIATNLRGQWRVAVGLYHTNNTDTMAELSHNAEGRKVTVKEQERLFALRKNESRLMVSQIAKEMREICDEVIALITDYLIPSVIDQKLEDHVFYLKIRADYYRYIAETMEGEARKIFGEKAEHAYQEAYKKSISLTAYNPVRMGLLLNMAVFHFEIYGNQTRAVKIARDAYDKCVSNMGKVPDDMLKDVKIIQDLLRDNLMLWCYSEETDI
ncbi:14-3-3 protein beta/alpha-1-like isoform X1 [Convolutriloba macropyga]|uniref:14-3-3 protein beta/alpha-1-like isoform X1 n=2 Tax=Convolutriloba macropyga TaxID=536237 RepID=UPI003F523119